jgi:integral membrane sensor domain MASE1
LCSPLLSATIGVSSLALTGYADWTRFSAMWLTWWLGDGVGMIVVTPLLLLWLMKLPWNFHLRHSAEALALLALIILMGQAVFGDWFSLGFMVYPVAYLCAPLLVWTAFRFDQREIITLNVVLSVIAVAGTMHGFGPFMRSTWHESILLLQVFLTITTITCLIVTALVSERKVLVAKLQDTIARVRTLSGLLPICAWCKKVRDDNGYWQEVDAYIRDHSDADISHGICPDCLITYKSAVLEHRRNAPKDKPEQP